MDEERETESARLLLELNEKFECFTGQVLRKLDSILELKDPLQLLCESKQKRRKEEADRKRDQRAREKAERNRGLLPLPKDIWRKDERILGKYLMWAHVGIQFGVTGDWRAFLQYLAHAWNTCPYLKKPIAKVSNRCHWWDRGMRHDCTWCDMFGSERGINPKTVGEIKWWDWQYHMLAVVHRMQEMPDWPNVNKEFVKAVQTACSGLAGCSEIGTYTCKGFELDHLEPKVFDVVPEFRYLTLHVMQAFKRGIIQGIDENLELIRIGKMRFLSQSVLLEKEACMLRFNYNLRDGKLPDEMRETAMHLKDLGFWTPPKLKQRVMTPEEEKSLPG